MRVRLQIYGLCMYKLSNIYLTLLDDGVRSLYNTLVENFPLQLNELAKLSQALTKAGQGNYVSVYHCNYICLY